ncbi:similar to Saccharomyces cerevisiae YKL135C APL2 Beta-adaptin, large subunit of the clathrin-associated protein (AP-1) complex [Maudiozyma saulgeensis]|uniref:AP complex subunit beta n=1 Tax=Maudiozyma saulgeensis TaxID=1789683 RepID=A0A1X7QZH0_9SACH|nr:similar to Saccharomyces cerevisiae YKL135C APL2 Beta-adaptin, large subunit of the clathrin-associated protein (AP-1) complex [Kazachstania saulgeensis]
MAPLDKKIKKFLKNSIRVAPKISDKGELAELRTGLVSQYPQTRKDAIKQTIKQMTLGKDVSTLFPDVLKNIATNDIEQKKLVYLYVMNYAEIHPELCILVVNTFVTDAQDPNPLIRCMAIRTMSMIRVDKILEYIETPLRKTLQDDNPYVRKTAVICVAKLFQLNKELCIELGVLEDLSNALGDENPMVIANAIASLAEIYNLDESAVPLPTLIQSHVDQFLNALNECTEWARVTILTALSEYRAADSLEAQNIIDRVTAHLQHVNPAVVLATIKVIIKNLGIIDGGQKSDLIMKKISSALISLMSTPPELQYVALKNIRIILEKYPEILTKELRIFYIKFNDPLYVKLEKVEILIRLVDPSNLKQCTLLLNELKEYSMEFDPEFVSRCILGLSQLGIKYSDERFIQKVLDILVELLESGQDSIKDDCCIAMCNLLRHCPTNASMSKNICSILNSWVSPVTLLQQDTAKCNYIWLMGEYPQYFSTLNDKIDEFVENFSAESTLTQTSLLITVVKLHNSLKGSVLQTVLEAATHETSEIDVRDMAMIYWRCLSIDDSSALVSQLCNLHAPVINSTIDSFTPEVLEKLLSQLGTISSVYFKPMDDSMRKQLQHQNVIKGKHFDELQSLAKNELESKNNDDILLDFDSESVNQNTSAQTQNNNLLSDLDDLFDFGATATPNNNSTPGTVTEGMKNLSLNNDASKSNTTSSNTEDLLNLF